jgi:hypothetical protein
VALYLVVRKKVEAAAEMTANQIERLRQEEEHR